jgi:hypothetical protein
VSEDGLQIFTIYDHPSDHPRHVVLRTWWITPRTPPRTAEALCDTLDEARAVMLAAGLVCLGRQPDEDPTIVESWI